MIRSNDISNFRFEKAGSGSYRVTYTTDKRGDFWVATVNDMTLTDATYRAEHAKVADIKALRDYVKEHGTHYNKYFEKI